MYGAVRAGALLAAVAAAVGMAVMLACAADPARLSRLVAWSHGWLPARPRALVTALSQSFAEGLAAVREPRQLALALAWSVPLWLAIAAQIWVVSLALGVVLPAAGSLLVTALLVVGVAVPTPGAVGGYHEAYRLAVTTVLRHRQRPRRRRRDRAPRGRLRPDARRRRVDDGRRGAVGRQPGRPRTQETQP